MNWVMLPKRSNTTASSSSASMITRPPMKNQPSVTMVTPMAP